MGAYARLYPRARVRALIFVMVIPVPAMVMLGYWLLIQILGGGCLRLAVKAEE